MREYPYQEYYRTIFYANAVIDGVMDSDADTDAVADCNTNTNAGSYTANCICDTGAATS